MIITNKMNLPQAFVNCIQNARHNEPGTLSATTLLKGTKEIILEDRHFEEIEIDASEEVWSVFGTAVHTILENQHDDAFKEEKFEVPIYDYKVTGKVDRYDMANETIEDWKTASVWKVIYRDFEDWRKQGLIYAYLLRQNRLNVRHIRFIALLKDFSATEAKRNSDYPQAPVYIFEYDVNDSELESVETYIKAKVLDVAEQSKLTDDEIKECSLSERWATATKYAVMKEGRKTALKVCSTEDEAQKFIDDTEKDKDKLSIEERPGTDKKCMDYCPCASFCSYYKKTLLV